VRVGRVTRCASSLRRRRWKHAAAVGTRVREIDTYNSEPNERKNKEKEKKKGGAKSQQSRGEGGLAFFAQKKDNAIWPRRGCW
jgi:hypothetical protein